MKFFSLIALIALLAGNAFGATMQGAFYEWSSFNVLENVVVDLNTVPEQVIVSKNGLYQFELKPGDYLMRAYYFEDSKLKYYAEETIHIQGEGRFYFDFLMTPPMEGTELIEVPEVLRDLNTALSIESKKEDNLLLVGLGLVIAVALLGLLFKWKRKEKIEEKKPELDEHAREVIEALKKSGNRLTQKELREKVSIGEAKVSLIVSELEKEGIVKKIKKGRGNIIVLKH
jgi:uncharacterized membrane protein